MFRKTIVTIFLLFFTNLTVSANCVTGYACSLSDLEKQDNSTPVEKQIKNHLKNDQKKVKTNKQKGFFRDGKERNKPEYTEVFTIKDIPLSP